jgi:hypothetical protein
MIHVTFVPQRLTQTIPHRKLVIQQDAYTLVHLQPSFGFGSPQRINSPTPRALNDKRKTTHHVE